MPLRKLSLLLFSILLGGTIFAQDVILKEGKYIIAKSGAFYTGVHKEYDSDHILVAQHSITNGILNGFTVTYYPSGAKKEERSYRDGKKDGTWINWNESGIRIAEARFKDGKKDGFWYVWDDQGVKRYEMFYEMGEKKGSWLIWDEQGNLVSRTEY
jgi:antitoxin component YwqK of YwqJK toxin-antitoxin module